MGTDSAEAGRAGFWIRAAAALLDGVLLLIISGFVGFIMVSLNDPIVEGSRSARIAGAMTWLAWLMYTTLEIFSGGTLGKKTFGLRIARADGAPDRWRLFLRWQTKQLPVIALILFELTSANAFRLLGGFASLVVAVGCLFAANDDRLAWHDQWSGTAVFHAKALRLRALPKDGEWAEIL
jgi:uncharacterized RDD family membrane protein YckC